LIVCERCGSHNADGENFCGACGAFLEWEGAPATPVSPAPVTPTLPPEPPVTTPPVSKPPVSKPPVTTTTAPVTTTPPVTATPINTAATTSGPAPRPPSDWPSPPSDDPPPRTAPVADTPPTNGTPTNGTEAERKGPRAVKPSEATRRRPTPTTTPTDEPPPAAGDLICGQCGAGNDPSRRFCRRCGASLLEAKVAPKPAWWRRLLARLRGRRYEAGYRRQVRQPVRIHGRVIFILMLAALILLAALPGRPYILAGSEVVKDRIRPHVRVTPIRAYASSSAPNAGPERIIDNVSNQFWAPAATGPAEGQWVEVDLPEPTRVLDLVIHTGISADRKQFNTQARPREVEITFRSENRKETRKVIRLGDETGKQEFQVRASRVVRIRITLRSAYGALPNRRVALAEVEIFGRG